MNCKPIEKMSIAIKLLVCPTLKQHPKKHIMFVFKVTSIGFDLFTERIPT